MRLHALLSMTVAVAGLCLASLAMADDPSDVTQLLRSGQPAEALARADEVIAANPRDAQMRFIRSMALSDLKRVPEAIETLVRLTQEYPELPEPFNNLAVIYASQGQYEQARVALESAIRNSPGYATARENLGDVYAKLASESYAKALALDPNNTTAKPKLDLIRSAFTASVSAAEPASPSASAP